MPFISGTSSGGGGSVAKICDQLLTVAQASFDTNTIIGGAISTTAYKHLQLVLRLRGNTVANSTNAIIRFNNDSGTNYDYAAAFTIGGATPAGTGATAQTSFDPSAGTCAAASSQASRFSTLVLDIPDYADTTGFKTVSGIFVGFSNASNYMLSNMGCWLSASAITRISAAPAAGSWAAGSRFTLYGMS